MTLKQVAQMVRSIGVPFSYYQFNEDTAVAPPFICFYYPEDFDLYADGENFQHIKSLIIELYTDNKDFRLEANVETALRSNGITWTRLESYIESEKLFMVTYQTSILIEEE